MHAVQTSMARSDDFDRGLKAMQAAISRRREALADASAVQMTRYPPGLISALEKLLADTTVTHSASKATAHL